MNLNLAKEQIARNNSFKSWDQLVTKYSSPTVENANAICNFIIDAAQLYELYATEKINYLNKKIKTLAKCK